MKAPIRAVVCAAIVGLASSCSSTNPQTNNHWNVQWVPRSIVYNTTGYIPERDGTYREFQWREKRHINLTLRRHFLNSNPYNPRQPEVPKYFEQRPPHSILPDPFNYFHLTSVVAGAVYSGASTSGAFVPIPVDSIIATLQPGGFEEFWAGIAGTKKDSISPYVNENPPAPEEFEVDAANKPRFVGN